MFNNQHGEIIAHFQSRTAIFNADECVKILQRFRWDYLEAMNYVLNYVENHKPKLSNNEHKILEKQSILRQFLICNDHSNELTQVCRVINTFRDRHSDLKRWPNWCKSTLEEILTKSNGPIIVLLNHDQSCFSRTFLRHVLCSSSILNLFTKYKCVLWPWDVTLPINQQRLVETNGRIRSILVECFSQMTNINSYPLLLLLRRQKDRITLLDMIRGNSDVDQTRATLEKIFNPVLEKSMISSDEKISLSPGWVGGRTVGNICRRPSFVTAFRLSRGLRATQRPHYVTFYKPKENTPDVILTSQDVQRWLEKKNKTNATSLDNRVKCHSSLSSKRIEIHRPTLSMSISDQSLFRCLSPRRAGWSLTVKH